MCAVTFDEGCGPTVLVLCWESEPEEEEERGLRENGRQFKGGEKEKEKENELFCFTQHSAEIFHCKVFRLLYSIMRPQSSNKEITRKGIN